jgi:hypothetical protein
MPGRPFEWLVRRKMALEDCASGSEGGRNELMATSVGLPSASRCEVAGTGLDFTLRAVA